MKEEDRSGFNILLESTRTDKSQLKAERQAYFSKIFRTIGFTFLLVGLFITLYSLGFLLMSLSPVFKEGKYNYQGLTINFALILCGSIAMVIFGVQSIRLASNVADYGIAKTLSLFGKIQLFICTAVAFAVYVVQSHMKWSS